MSPCAFSHGPGRSDTEDVGKVMRACTDLCLRVLSVMDLGGQGMEDEQNNNERKMIRRPAPTDADKWNALPEVPKRAGKLEVV